MPIVGRDCVLRWMNPFCCRMAVCTISSKGDSLLAAPVDRLLMLGY